MSDKPKQANRIPFEHIVNKSVSAWSLPTVDQKKNVVFGVKKAKNKGRDPASDEVVEDYSGAAKPQPLTAAQLQEIAEEAKREGYEQGFIEGREKGLVKGEAEGTKKGYERAYTDTQKKIKDEVERFQDIASTLLTPMEAQQTLLENILVEMAMCCAQEIIGHEVQSDPQITVDIVNRALSALPVGAENIVVYLGQEEAALVEHYLPREQRAWDIRLDKDIQPGGCRVETQESLVEYTAEKRMAQFLEQVREHESVDTQTFPPVPNYERKPSAKGQCDEEKLSTKVSEPVDTSRGEPDANS